MTKLRRASKQYGRLSAPSGMDGFGMLGWLVAIPLLLIGLVVIVFVFYEARKAYWDHKVTQMCEKDGGVKIFEKIRLNAEDYRRLNGTQGEIPIYERRSAPPMAEYVSDTERVTIRQGSPQVWRTEATIRAVTQNSSLARYVNYSRVGGDFPTYAHPSSFSCDQGSGSVSRQIFIIEGVAR